MCVPVKSNQIKLNTHRVSEVFVGNIYLQLLLSEGKKNAPE